MNEYISITQFAQLHKMDRANVHKLVVAGRIPAIRIGNQWAIPADAQKPKDRRIITGEYKNWRKKNGNLP